MAQKKRTKAGVWVILGLIFFSLIGFGTTNLSSGASNLGTVGDKQITIVQYSNALRQTVNVMSAQLNTQITMQQALAAGMSQETLNSLVNQRVLENAVSEMGLSAGDARVSEAIKANPSFAGAAGAFDREAYNYVLKQTNTSVKDFENSVRDSLASEPLKIALLAGVAKPDQYADVITSHFAELRDITWATVSPSILTEALPEPTAEELQTYYEANAAAYTLPETKVISYAALTPDMIKDSIAVDEQALRDLYNQNIAQYQVPERRLVERLGFADEAAAQAAMEAITAGTTDFDTLVADRGLTLDDVDLGDVAIAQLDDAGEAVFAAQAGDVVGPFPSLVGPALFRMNAVLDAENTTFEEAQSELRAELAGDRAKRVIDDQTEQFIDLVAGGATIADLEQRTDMQSGSIEWTADSSDGMAAYPEFREAAAAAKVGDYMELKTLNDGGVFVLQVDEVREPTVRPFAEVEADVRTGWTAEARQNAVVAAAQEMAAAMTADTDFATLGLTATVETDLKRQSFLDRTPQGFITEVFAAEAGASFAMPYNNGAVLVRVDAIKAADMEDSDTQAIKTELLQRISNGISQDIYDLGVAQLRMNTKINIDNNVVNAVHAQIQ